MIIKLYSVKDEKIVLNKTLENELEISGNFRGDVDVLSPSIEIKTDVSILKYNYCFIPSLERYYFITNHTFTTYEICQLELTEDVLMSFRDSILNQKCFVIRNEFFYDPMIVDSKIPVKSGRKVSYIVSDMESPFETPFTDDTIIGDLIQTRFSYVLNCNVNTTFLSSDKLTFERLDNNPYNTYKSSRTNFCRSYCFKYGDITEGKVNDVDFNLPEVIDGLQGADLGAINIFGDNPAENVYSLINYPFDVIKFIGTANTYGNGNLYNINVGKTNLTYGDGVQEPLKAYLLSTSSYFKLCGHIKFNGNSFIDTDKFTSYSLYLPYVGIVNLNGDLVYNKDIYVWYSIDFVTGYCLCCLTYSNNNPLNNNDIVMMVNGKIGYDIPIGSTNAGQTTINNITRFANFAKDVAVAYFTKGVSLVGTDVTKYTASGSSTENTTRVRNDKTGRMRTSEIFTSKSDPKTMTKTTDRFRKKDMEYPSIPSVDLNNYSKGTLGMEINNLFMNNKIFAIVEKTVTAVDDEGFYAHTYGKPCAYTYKLNDFNGFTVVGETHLTDIKTNSEYYAIETEKEEIMSLLQSGIIINKEV